MSNVIEQFKALADYNLFSPLFIIALSFIVISAVLLIVNTKLKNKIIEIIYCSILATLVLCIVYFYRKVIFAAFDSLVEEIMKLLFFPSFFRDFIYVYFFCFIITLCIKDIQG